MYTKKSIELLCLFLCIQLAAVVSVSGQQRLEITENSLSQLIQRSYQIEDGLPQNTVSAIAQTDEGYLWFGTDEGLARFNGSRFTVFDAANTEAFSVNQSVRSLALGSDGSLWIGTDGGGVVRFSNGIFTAAAHGKEPFPMQVVALLEDQSGTLWIGTFDDGLWRLTNSERVPQQVVGDLAVLGLSEDSLGRVYAATSDGLLRVVGNDAVEPFGSPYARSTPAMKVFADSNENIWFTTRDGVFRLNSGLDEESVSKIPGLAFLEDSRHATWIGLDGEGLVRIDSQQESLSTEDGLTHDRVVSLFEDREGSIWIGTEGGGIVQLTVGSFVTYGLREGLTSESILSVASSEDGSVWAGTEGGGLYRFRNGTIEHYGTDNGLSDDIITSLASRDGTTWVGTFYGGLNRVDPRGILHFGVNEGLPAGVVGAIALSDDGSLWVGTDGGLSQISKGDVRTFTTKDGLGSNYITAIAEDDAGTLWIGTYGGLFLFDGRATSAAQALSDNTILSIAEDSEDHLWVSTLHDGIYIKDGTEWYQFSRRNGLPSNGIYQVLFDHEDDVWMSSNKGLFSGRRQSVLDAARTQTTAHLATKTRSDGLRSTEFNGGVYPAGAIDTKGRLWFPSIRGVATTDPGREVKEPEWPSVVLENIQVNGNPRGEQFLKGSIKLEPGEKKLEISAAAVSFRARDELFIEYQLSGQDDDWARVQPGQFMTYTNLAPGSYTLRLRPAREVRGVVSTGPESSFSVTLAPYLYQRAGAWLAALIAIALIIMALHRIRIRAITNRERQKNVELEQVVVQRTHELKQLNESLAEKVEAQVRTQLSERVKFENKLIDARDRAMESDRLKSTILTNLGHEFRTPITSILGFTDIIAEKLEAEDREFTSYIKSGAQRLLDTVTTLIDLSELEAKAVRHSSTPVAAHAIAQDVVEAFEPVAQDKGITLTVDSPPQPVIANTDPALLHKAITALVNNAVKYTDDGGVVVAVRANDAEIAVSVRDTGIGVSEDFMPDLFAAFKQESNGENRQYEGCGLGLTVAQRLTDILGGCIEVESTLGTGSTFTIRIPRENTGSVSLDSRTKPLPKSEAA